MIYLDYAGSTPVLPELLEHYKSVSEKFWGNPSATHPVGQLAKAELERSRLQILETLKLSRDDYNAVFTGGITEANSLALNSFINSDSKIAYTVLEHDSIINNLGEESSVKINITEDGFIDLEDLEEKLLADKEVEVICLVGINSEIGTIQPITEARKIVDKVNITRLDLGYSVVKIFSDLAQAPNWINLGEVVSCLDLFTLSSSKIYSPKGTGCLVYKKQIQINPINNGGKQEFGIRAGTENVVGISTFAKALELVQNNVSTEVNRVGQLRDYLWEKLTSASDKIEVNGYYLVNNSTLRVANNLNIFIPQFYTEEVLTALSLKNVCVSSGSNCRSGAITSSALFQVIGVEKQGANLRITLGKFTTKDDIDEFISILFGVLKSLS